MSESMHPTKLGGVKINLTPSCLHSGQHVGGVLYSWDQNRLPFGSRSSPHPSRYADTPQPLAEASNKYAKGWKSFKGSMLISSPY